ncbi:hypothetical protein VHEMI07785 [[Torrubiella] hemipterigena]|uniref:Uncharacterized protein n=1 Tax=[Torrubiella] hemipterigena TaxID=1531966 RepID=A0A0A1TNK6_9HYPO|nr:hypothetical protein VHEMI07785 [[Torrubiella] hemipterigena]
MTLVQIPEDGLNIQLTPQSEQTIPDTEAEINDDGDDEERIKTLTLTMTTKSLQNLASYPNPSQRSAQKALKVAHAARLRANLQYVPTGVDLDSLSIEKLSSYPTDAGLSSGILRHTQSEPAPLRLHSQRAEANVQASCSPDAVPAQLGNRSPVVAHLSPLTYSEAAGGGRPSSDILVAGPGVPRPLTAGPPGQRQYRPSTFDLTFGTMASATGRSKTETDGYNELRGSAVAVGRPASAVLHTKLDGALARGVVAVEPSKMDELGYTGYGGTSALSALDPSNSIQWRRAITPQDGVVNRPQCKNRTGRGDATRWRDHLDNIWFSGIRALEDTLARIDGEMQRAIPDGHEQQSGIASSEPVLALALASLTLAVEEQSYQPGGNYQCYSDVELKARLPGRQATRMSSRSGSESGMSLLYSHWQTGEVGDVPAEQPRLLTGE